MNSPDADPFPPDVDQADRTLLARAHSFGALQRLSDCSADALATLSASQGIDLATALLFDRLRNSPPHAALARRIEGPPITPIEPMEIVVVPGAFHQHHRHTGADGQRIVELAALLGCKAHRVPLPSFAPLRQNAEMILTFLQQLPAERIVLASLSKGGADVRAMFGQLDSVETLSRVVAWVNLSGMVNGTPLVDWLRARPLRCLGVRALLRLRGQSFAALTELRRQPVMAPWPALPPRLKIMHVLGFAIRRHLSHPWATRGYQRLAPLGPNDGGGILLGDAVSLPGFVYPVWAADHYLQPQRDIIPLLLNLFRDAASTAV